MRILFGFVSAADAFLAEEREGVGNPDSTLISDRKPSFVGSRRFVILFVAKRVCFSVFTTLYSLFLLASFHNFFKVVMYIDLMSFRVAPNMPRNPHVYIGHIPIGVHRDDLEKELETFGPVKLLDMRDGFAFVVRACLLADGFVYSIPKDFCFVE